MRTVHKSGRRCITTLVLMEALPSPAEQGLPCRWRQTKTAHTGWTSARHAHQHCRCCCGLLCHLPHHVLAPVAPAPLATLPAAAGGPVRILRDCCALWQMQAYCWHAATHHAPKPHCQSPWETLVTEHAHCAAAVVSCRLRCCCVQHLGCHLYCVRQRL